MSWTYSGNPASSDNDKVRFLVGDTDETDQLVQDEEIAYALTTQPTAELAAALVAEAIAAKFARQVDSTVGRVSESASQRAMAFRERAKELRSNIALLARPSFGGLSQAEKERLDSDTDAVQPSFRIGQDDNPESPSERDTPPRRGLGPWY